jgi:two-component system, OmpR family, alkaline phosphatase synthesis response regulator PhoP
MLNCRLFEVLAVFITSPLGLEKCLLELGVTNISLTSKEFQILFSLIQNSGKVLTREKLYTSIWNKQSDNLQRTLDMHISTLRKKIRFDKKLYKTIRSSGYKIELKL